MEKKSTNTDDVALLIGIIVVLNIVACVICFFGGTRRILWLVVVGIILRCLTWKFEGMISLFTGVLIIVLLIVFRGKLLSWDPGKVALITSFWNWLVGEELNIFYIARTCIFATVATMIFNLTGVTRIN